jgi:hypothetical protein
LVDYCLGDWRNKPVFTCTRHPGYLKRLDILLLETGRRHAVVFAGGITAGRKSRAQYDLKQVVVAMVSQRADIPPDLGCWLVRDDSAGIHTDPQQGLHITGVRHPAQNHLVLVPTANRNRFLGPNLEKQMEELSGLSVPWEEKSDTAWWGGALTGDKWNKHALTRREALCYYRDHPSDQVCLQLTEIPADTEAPPGVKLERQFTKKSAFRHKCLVLLPGNDIASGSSWYFCGNSVVLMPKPRLEHILYFEMRPWEHYVPLESGAADILVKLRWVLDNQEQAKRIVANSHERLRWLCGEEYLWACNEVLRHIAGKKRLDQ